jgi:hypothetical protein
VINYYRFCCRIRIADEYADEVPGGEFLAVEDGHAEDRRQQFSDARVSEFSDWFHETPALLAHVTALSKGDTRPLRARLVDTEAAMVLSGRTRQGLDDMARRGRLTKYRRDGRPAWDALEVMIVTSDTST